MYIYARILTGGVALIACIVILLWIILINSRNDKKLNMRDASLSSEELEDHAKKIAIEHSVSQKQNLLNWPVPRMNDNYDFIRSVFKELNEDVQKTHTVPSEAEWLLDNFYIIEEQVKGLRRDLDKKNYSQLPVLRTGPLKGYARIFAVVVELVAHTDGQMDEMILSNYLKVYQLHSVLFDREILAIPMVIKLALIENIRQICENIKNTLLQWHKADEIFYDWMDNEVIDANLGMKLFKDGLKTMNEANPSFIEHLFYRLRRSGRSYVKVLRTMDENLAKLGTTTEQITQKQHSSQSINTVSLGNSMTSLRAFATLDWADFFESASYVEQILKQDPDGTYPVMDLFSRNYYRHRVEELASIYGVSELHIAREVVDLAKQACAGFDIGSVEGTEIQRTWHVGYYLIGKGIKSLENRQEKKINFCQKRKVYVKIFQGLYILALSG